MKTLFTLNERSIIAYPQGFEIYKSGIFKTKFRWRVTADNGRVIGASSQGYVNLQDCKYNAISLGQSLNKSILFETKPVK